MKMIFKIGKKIYFNNNSFLEVILHEIIYPIKNIKNEIENEFPTLTITATFSLMDDESIRIHCEKYPAITEIYLVDPIYLHKKLNLKHILDPNSNIQILPNLDELFTNGNRNVNKTATKRIVYAKFGAYCNEIGPAMIEEYLTQKANRREFFQNGKLHRINGPAVEYHNGSQIFYHQGKELKLPPLN